MKPITV